MGTLIGKTVLLVEDEKRNVFALSSFLESLQINTIVAYDGEEALKIINSGIFLDMVLLDMMMPVMDGFEVLKMLWGSDFIKKTPVVAVTAKAMKGDREKCLEAGAWEYISKPVDLKLLTQVLNEKMI